MYSVSVAACTLVLPGFTVLTAANGTPEVEYALFDPGEILLEARGPGDIREAGYQTRVGSARARLADQGITADLAEGAAQAAGPLTARAYARGRAARVAAERIEAAELFDGHTFNPATERYEGAWLDLPALAADLGLAEAHSLMQAMHLAALLSERADDDLVVLSTGEASLALRARQRTFKRVIFESPEEIVPALRALRPTQGSTAREPGPGTREIIARLRARAVGAPGSRTRLAAIEALLCTRELPPRGPLADDALWAIEAHLDAGGDPRLSEQIDDIERQRGRLPGTIYLRARAALLGSLEAPRDIAERMSELSTSMPDFHEAELLA
ncbi:MAG: hypothetical protein ACREJ3_09825, partial [Polyangiaceae bacterium]